MSMNRRLPALAILITLLLTPALHAKDPGLLTYDQYLASRGLTQDDVECINNQTEDVLNPGTQEWDKQRTVCEVWTKEKVIPEKVIPKQVTPRKRVTFKDGTPVYMATHSWTEDVPTTESRPVSKDLVVRQNKKSVKQPDVTSEFKSYIPRGN